MYVRFERLYCTFWRSKFC